MPLLLDLEPARPEADFDLPDEAPPEDRAELLDLREVDFAAVDFAEPDRAELDPVERDLAELDLAEPDFAAEPFAAVVLDLEAPPVDRDFEAAPDFAELLFFADPPLFAVEDFAVEDFAPADRLDEVPALDFEPADFDELDFDVVDFAEPDFAPDFDFEELVDFLVVAILDFLHFLQIGFERTFRVLQ